MDDALCILAIDDFPGFTHGHARRQGLAEEGLQASPAPYAFHGERFEDEGLIHCGGNIAAGMSSSRRNYSSFAPKKILRTLVSRHVVFGDTAPTEISTDIPVM